MPAGPSLPPPPLSGSQPASSPTSCVGSWCFSFASPRTGCHILQASACASLGSRRASLGPAPPGMHGGVPGLRVGLARCPELPWAGKQAGSRSGYLQAGAAASGVCLHNQLEQLLACVVSFTLSVRGTPRLRIWPPLHWTSPAQGLLRKSVLGTSISRAGGPFMTPPPTSSQQQPWAAQEWLR